MSVDFDALVAELDRRKAEVVSEPYGPDEFTGKDFAANRGVTHWTAMRHINQMVALGIVEDTGRQTPGQHPSKIFRMVNRDA